MLEFDSPFRQQVARSLKAPNSPAFDLKAWEELIKVGSLSSSDLGLCATAMWIAAEAMSLRESSRVLPRVKRTLVGTVTTSENDPSLRFDDQFCCGAQQRCHVTVW